jgi:hypothetical protein
MAAVARRPVASMPHPAVIAPMVLFNAISVNINAEKVNRNAIVMNNGRARSEYRS